MVVRARGTAPAARCRHILCPGNAGCRVDWRPHKSLASRTSAVLAPGSGPGRPMVRCGIPLGGWRSRARGGQQYAAVGGGMAAGGATGRRAGRGGGRRRGLGVVREVDARRLRGRRRVARRPAAWPSSWAAAWRPAAPCASRVARADQRTWRDFSMNKLSSITPSSRSFLSSRSSLAISLSSARTSAMVASRACSAGQGAKEAQCRSVEGTVLSTLLMVVLWPPLKRRSS